MMRYTLVLLITVCLLCGVFLYPASAQTDITPEEIPLVFLNDDVDYGVQWMQMLYNRVEGERRSVPQAARIYGYAGVTLYLSLMPEMDLPRLDITQLNDLPPLPQVDTQLPLDGVSVVIGALRVVTTGLMAPLPNLGTTETMLNFNTAESNATARAIAALANRQYGERLRDVNREIVDRSVAYGESLGAVVLEWAESDQFAETRTMTYTPPQNEGFWVETTPGQHAMEPYWGMLRPFTLPAADACSVTLDVPFDADADSTFHMQAMEVYLMSQQLTDEQRDIARFWDERVGESGTASGHWLVVQNDLVDALDLSLEDAATMYALVGVAMADSFISAWHTKYTTHLLRPETYINTYIDPHWEPLRQAPPFPAYPSGHAVLGSAVAETLTALYGPVAYIDRYGVRYGIQAQLYTSFEAAAYENALSRLYGGVHYRVDMENGLEQGRCVGRAAVGLLMSR